MDDQSTVLLETAKNETDFFAKARILQDLNKNHSVSIKNLSEKMSLKASYLCHILRLNKLPPLVIDGYYSGTVSLSHLFVISRLKDHQQMNEVYERVLSENLTVLKTEEIVREMLYDVTDSGQRLSKDETEALIAGFSLPNVRVKVVQTRIKSKILLEVKGNLAETSATLRKLSGIVGTSR